MVGHTKPKVQTLGDWHLKGGLQLCPLEFLCSFVFLCLDFVLYYMLNSCISGINQGIHVNKVCISNSCPVFITCQLSLAILENST